MHQGGLRFNFLTTTRTAKKRTNPSGTGVWYAAAPMHNVHFVKYDGPVVKS